MRFFILFSLLFAALPARAHEFWIDPQVYLVQKGEKVKINLRNGENFVGQAFSYNPRTFRSFDHHIGGKTAFVPGIMGDRPAAQLAPKAEGLWTFTYVSSANALDYTKQEKFDKFVDHKDLRGAIAGSGKETVPLRERYVRFSKALLAVGTGAGADQAQGMLTEFVALENPYTFNGTSLPVQLFYKGAIRADAQVELFEKAPDGSVTVTLHRTNAEGIASLPVKAGHQYLVDAVVIRTPEVGSSDWETLWAALTFQMR